MLKRLLLWIFSGSLDGFSQSNYKPGEDYLLFRNDTLWCCVKSGAIWSADCKRTITDTGGPGAIRFSTGLGDPGKWHVTTPDTLRAELLLTYTTRRWGVAHARDGYVVKKDGKVIRFLDDRKRRFGPTTRLWGWIVNEEKVMP